MRPLAILNTLLALLLFANATHLYNVNIGDGGLMKRDDPPPSSIVPSSNAPSSSPPPEKPSPSPSPTASPTASPAPSPSGSDSSQQPKSHTAPPDTKTIIKSTRSLATNSRLPTGVLQTGPSATTIVSEASATHSSIVQLPVQPAITPAIGLAGVILILSGFAYTLIGVQQKWVQISFSAGYLTALAITVLVVYVADPPVTDAVQGAYFVAAFVPGCIIGGLSLIFTEVTEGLGCLLGGFCFSMWLMVLQPGGLLTSTGGRVGLIAGFSAFGFAFAFSHYTRNWALIVCTSFAGATIIILGIDCFSRAGLKEFWLYIWDLNEKLFPLNTHTYPLTRGMKVEIAVNIVLFLCGVLAQMKLWGLLKERRKKRAEQQAQDEEDRERLETDIGRNVEDLNARERREWEVKYGDKSAATANTDNLSSTVVSLCDSRPQSVKNQAVSVKEVRLGNADGYEMTDMTEYNRQSRVSMKTMTTSISAIEKYADEPSNGPRVVVTEEFSDAPVEILSQRSRNASVRTSMARSVNGNISSNASPRSSVPPPPTYVPLPFRVPASGIPDDEDDKESLATAGETILDAYGNEHQILDFPTRIPVVPHHDQDDASSLAATADGRDGLDDDLPQLSRPTSPSATQALNPRRSVRKSTIRKVGSASDLQEIQKTVQAEAPLLKRRNSLPTQKAEDQAIADEEEETTEDADKGIGLWALRDTKKRETIDTARFSEAESYATGARSLSAAGGKSPLPEQLPKVALYYRTNEWAKHLETADAPDLDPLNPTEAGVAVGHSESESVVPVNVSSLQQTATNATPAPLRNASQNSTNPYRRSGSHRSVSDQSHVAANRLSQAYSVESDNPQAPFKRSASSTSARRLSNPTRGIPNSIVNQILVESPIEEAQSTVGELPGRTANLPVHNATLLNQRNDMLQRKAADLNLTRNSSTTSLLQQNRTHSSFQPFNQVPSVIHEHQDSDNVSLSSRRQQILAEEDMPLSQRRQVIRSQSARSSQHIPDDVPLSAFLTHSPSPPLPQTTWPQPQMQAPSGPIYDSHQPRRGGTLSDQQRNQRLASWRAAQMADATNASNTQISSPLLDETARMQMLYGQRRMQEEAARKEIERERVAVQVEGAVRRGELTGTHREMLRNMQRTSHV